jgi:predicted nucleotidyltransferase
MKNQADITAEITRRIVERFHPQRVVLFGSRARGDAREDSDYDVLIVAPSDKEIYQRVAPVYSVLAGMGIAKDLLWFTPEEVADWQNVKPHIISRAMREGKVLYEVQP